MTTNEQPLSQREFYDAILPNLATKTDIAELKAELAQLEAKLLRWLIGVVVTSFGAGAGIAFAAVRVFGS